VECAEAEANVFQVIHAITSYEHTVLEVVNGVRNGRVEVAIDEYGIYNAIVAINVRGWEREA
jgi:adenosine/AMP kinase